jgi:hypothetical protein
MTYRYLIESSATIQTEGLTPFRLQGVDRLPVMAQEDACHIIKQYFDHLEEALSDPHETVDITQLQEMLLELSLFLRSGKSQIEADGYLRLLNRLTAIYAKGLQVKDDRAFARTAANYADILELVSQSFLDYDYSESIGLLLHYMDKLFNYREESWIEVYEHLLCMPDSIHILQQLKIDHLDEIKRWIEEGVNNLYTLWDEQLELIEMQSQNLQDADTEIIIREQRLEEEGQRFARTNMADLALVREKREVAKLICKRDELYSQWRSKLEIVGLLESNIAEFADRLARMRRSALLHLAWVNPVPVKDQ